MTHPRGVARAAGWLALGFSLALGCAAQYEEPVGAQPDDEVAAEAVPATEVTAAEPEPAPAGAVERSLVDLQSELANNTAQLRALGVMMPPRTTIGGGDMYFGGEAGAIVQERPDPADAPVPGGSGGTTAPKPESHPSPATPDGDAERPSTKGKGQGRKDKPNKKAETKDDRRGGFAPPPPEEAKSTPLGPNEQPKLDAATRCAQVCSLSDLTCELGVQICELAQRHPDNDEYELACVQATEDCDAAQEACDACTG